jgi:epidermal growth factor receptor substrate 15
VDDAAQAPQPLSSFDDEFAGFDDEFDTRSSQVNSGSASGDASLSKSYEMVSPQAIATSTSDGFDEWGLAPATATTATAPPVASFDDAFGASEPLES